MRFLERLGLRGPKFPPPSPARPVYAIGDVHGRADLLIEVLEKILADAGRFDGRPEVVILGDYVDRGEDTADTLTFLLEVAAWSEIELIPLIGNHERMLLDFLKDPERGETWLEVGGLQTLSSYGVPVAEKIGSRRDHAALRDALAEAMGPHAAFLEDARYSHRNGNIFFCHAGADPAAPTEVQLPKVLMWGHPEFRRRPRADGVWVVHGHRVVDKPVAERGVISLDTGAYFTDRLSAVCIAESELRFFEA